MKELVDRGVRPYILDVDAGSARLAALLTAEQLATVHFMQGDVTRLAEVESAIVEHGITHVLHLAGIQVPGCAADPIRGAMVNVIGTLNVLEAARRRRDLVQRVRLCEFGRGFWSGGSLWGSHGAGRRSPAARNTLRRLQAMQRGERANLLSRPWDIERGTSPLGRLRRGAGSRGSRPGPPRPSKPQWSGGPTRFALRAAWTCNTCAIPHGFSSACAEAPCPGAKLYTLRGSVIQVQEFTRALERVLPQSAALVRAEGKHLPIAYDLDDSALRHDLGDVPSTPLEEGIRRNGCDLRTAEAGRHAGYARFGCLGAPSLGGRPG